MFWKKFLKLSLVGLSVWILLFTFQSGSTTILAQYSCPAPTGSVTFTTPANQVLPAGTPSTTVSWNPAQNASAYFVIVKTSAGANIYNNENHTGNSVTVTGLQNGQSYVVSVRPKNNCESGGLYQLNFSIAGTPDQSTGTLNCSISQSQPIPQGNNSYLYTLTGNSPSAASSWGWDLTNDGSIDRYDGPTIQQQYFSNATVRLRITDSSGNFGDCTTTITLPNQTGNVSQAPICSISAYPSNNVAAGTNVTLTGNGTAYSGKYITSYQWDFDNNGSYDTSVSGSSNTNYTFYNPQTIRLHVVDSAGLGGDCTTYINIGNQYPGGSCSTDTFLCPDGTRVSRNPNNACQFYACPTTPFNQCRILSCLALPAGCYYTVQPLTFSCDPNVQVTCGQWTCPTNPPIDLCNTVDCSFLPNFPNPFGGNSQNTWVGVANANSNINDNFNWSDSFSSSWASGGGAGSANVTINW